MLLSAQLVYLPRKPGHDDQGGRRSCCARHSEGLGKHLSESGNKAARRKLCAGRPGAASAMALGSSRPLHRPAPEHSHASRTSKCHLLTGAVLRPDPGLPAVPETGCWDRPRSGQATVANSWTRFLAPEAQAIKHSASKDNAWWCPFILHLVTANLTHPDHSQAKRHMAISNWKKRKLCSALAHGHLHRKVLWCTVTCTGSTAASPAFLEAVRPHSHP